MFEQQQPTNQRARIDLHRRPVGTLTRGDGPDVPLAHLHARQTYRRDAHVMPGIEGRPPGQPACSLISASPPERASYSLALKAARRTTAQALQGTNVPSMTTTGLILGLLIAAAGSAAGIGAWRAAAILAQIERQRRPSELTPQFEITCDVQATAAGHADLRVILRGPDTLDTLDEVTIRILDERWQDHGARVTPGGPSAEDIAKHVWGPWEFNTGASAQVADNQTTLARPYSRKTGRDWDCFSLVPSAPPYWASGMTAQQWLRHHDGQPIRLMVSCRLGDYRWELPYDVPRQQPAPGKRSRDQLIDAGRGVIHPRGNESVSCCLVTSDTMSFSRGFRQYRTTAL